MYVECFHPPVRADTLISNLQHHTYQTSHAQQSHHHTITHYTTPHATRYIHTTRYTLSVNCWQMLSSKILDLCTLEEGMRKKGKCVYACMCVVLVHVLKWYKWCSWEWWVRAVRENVWFVFVCMVCGVYACNEQTNLSITLLYPDWRCWETCSFQWLSVTLCKKDMVQIQQQQQ